MNQGYWYCYYRAVLLPPRFCSDKTDLMQFTCVFINMVCILAYEKGNKHLLRFYICCLFCFSVSGLPSNLWIFLISIGVGRSETLPGWFTALKLADPAPACSLDRVLSNLKDIFAASSNDITVLFIISSRFLGLSPSKKRPNFSPSPMSVMESTMFLYLLIYFETDAFCFVLLRLTLAVSKWFSGINYWDTFCLNAFQATDVLSPSTRVYNHLTAASDKKIDASVALLATVS